MRRLLALLATLALLFGAAACSSDSDDKAADEESSTTTEATDEPAEDDEEPAEDDEEPADDDETSAADATEDDYVDALMGNLMEDDSPVSEDEGRCMAEGIVDEIGVDTLQEAGVTPDQFAEDGPGALGGTATEAQGEAIAAIFMGCLESPAAFLASVMGASGDDAVACIEENLDESALEEFFAAAIIAEEGSEPPPEMITMFEELAVACPEVMGNTTG